MDERDSYQLTKSRLHSKILDRLELDKLRKKSGDPRDEILVVIRSEVNAEVVPLSFAVRERLTWEILHDILGGTPAGGPNHDG